MENNGITQWEYKYISANDIDDINREGAKGWEATGNGNSHGLLFKRPKPQPQRPQASSDDYGYGR